MKDHEKAQLVNRLKMVAIEFGHSQQLRDRISHEILPALDAERARVSKLVLKHTGVSLETIEYLEKATNNK